MQIEVVLRNLTPIFSAAPGSNYIGIDGTFNPPMGSSRFPLTRARTLNVVADTDDGVAKIVPMPVVPGNTMRNLLRRTMLKAAIEPTLCANGAQLKVGAYAAAYSGNASGNPDGIPSSFDEVVAMRAHPFLGLFGGGPRMLQGRLSVDNLWPIHQNTLRVVGTDYINDSLRGRITDIVWTRRNDPVLEMESAEDAAVIEGGANAANGWITDLLNASNAKKAKAKAKDDGEEVADENAPRGLQAFNAHEVVIAGVKWVWRIGVDNPTDAQVGLILLALNKIENERIAGGHAKDYGRIAIEGVSINGNPVWAPGGISDPSTEKYFDAIAQALDSMSGAEFEQFATSAKKEA